MYSSTEDTVKHIEQVQNYIREVISMLRFRAIYHDASKLYSPEKAIFDEHTPKLSDLEYGTKEYEQSRKSMGDALDHHYRVNRHHPEHFANGIGGMSIIDILEMVCDWNAAVLRHKDGDIYKSLKINKERFGISDQLYNILKNTVDGLE